MYNLRPHPRLALTYFCSLGPEELTCGTLTTDESACIPTVVQNAYSQGLIPAEELGISFAPITGSSGSDTNGVLTFGGVDTSQYTGTLTYTYVRMSCCAHTD